MIFDKDYEGAVDSRKTGKNTFSANQRYFNNTNSKLERLLVYVFDILEKFNIRFTNHENSNTIEVVNSQMSF